jgi:hypothetical protein
VIGAHEARGRAVLAEQWFETLDAPEKELITFDRSGHRPLFEEPALFASVMNEILDSTYLSVQRDSGSESAAGQ